MSIPTIARRPITATEAAWLIAILALGVFFRFHQLDRTPPGLFPDIAVNGTDAIRALEQHRYLPFYLANNGREGLFINLCALAFQLFGVSVLSIKIVAAAAGTLTVFGTFLLVRAWIDARTALWATLFLATSVWHVTFSRIGFRVILAPLFLVYFVLFLHYGVRTRRTVWYAAAGAALGGGLYTYIAFRMAPLLLIPAAVALWLAEEGGPAVRVRRVARLYGWPLLVLLATAAVVAAPLVSFLLRHPEALTARAAQVSIFSPVFNEGHPLRTAMLSVLRAAGKFNLIGDRNVRHNLSGWPQLNPAVGLLFLAGLWWAVRSAFGRGARDADRPVALILVGWLLVLQLPEVLTADQLPHAIRSLAVLPVPMVLGAIALTRMRLFRRAAAAICLALFVIAFDYWAYFRIWGHDPRVYAGFNTEYVNVAEYLDAQDPAVRKYVVVNPEGSGIEVDGLPIHAQSVAFVLHGKPPVTYVRREVAESFAYERPAILGFLSRDQALAKGILARSGPGEVMVVDPMPGTNSMFQVVRLR